MDNNNIMDTNNNITDNNNIKSIKKKHSFKKKKKARPILSQHGGAKYDFDSRCGIHSTGQMSCWMDACLQMLWDIDCLREYLLDPTSEENITKLQPITEKTTEDIKDLVTKNYPYFQEQIFGNTNFSEFIAKDIDKFDGKVETILALKSIFKTYNSTIERINGLSKDEKNTKFTIGKDTDTDTDKDNLIKDGLIAVIDDNIFLGINKADEASEAEDLINKIFNLFKDIDDKDVIKLRKCFTTIHLHIDKKYYELRNPSIVILSGYDENEEIQSLLDKTYIYNKNKTLIPFEETKFILLMISRPIVDNVFISKPCSITNLITINKRKYKLQGTIIHTSTNALDKHGKQKMSGHYIYCTYDDKGEIAVLLNGSIKTLYKDFIARLTDTDKLKYNPDTNGVFFLYQLADEPGEVAKADAKDDTAIIADALSAAIAVGADTSQPDTNVAAALTATLAAAVPDTSSTTNIPAAPTQSAKPPDQSAKPPANPPTAKPPTAKPPTAKPPTAKPPGGDLDDNVDRQQLLASGLQKREKPPGEENVVEKPYSGSLEPSSDSNGENMVLGILLVITLAISGVLFVQH
jgi:hypothetical protein